MEADVGESRGTGIRKGDSLRFLLWERRQRQQSPESATVAAAIAYKRFSAVYQYIQNNNGSDTMDNSICICYRHMAEIKLVSAYQWCFNLSSGSYWLIKFGVYKRLPEE